MGPRYALDTALGPEFEAQEQVARRTAADLVLLHSPVVAVIAMLWLLCEAARPFGESTGDVLGVNFVAGVVFLILGAYVLLRRGPDPIPRREAMVIVLCCVLAALANVVALAAGEHGPGALWSWSSASLMMAFLALRGRVFVGWIGAALTSAVYLAWGLGWLEALFGTRAFRGQLRVDIIGIVAWQASVVALVSFFGWAIRRQVERFDGLHRRRVALALARAKADAVLRERDEQLAYLDRIARPLLERADSPAPPSDQDERAALLAEARLHDRIRARALARESLLDGAARARERGVQVVLLDDGALAGAVDEVVERVADTVEAELEAVRAGTVTARVQPPGRNALCTIVSGDDKGIRRVEVFAGAELGSVTVQVREVGVAPA
jgi:hypothetical protein